jgi:hypothetical protein
MNAGHDKLRVLLIDDQPSGLYNRETRKDYPWINDPPDGPAGFSDLFDLRWVATAMEAREYRDLSRLIAQQDPTRIPWLPEIVVIDYMLLDKHGTAEERLRSTPKRDLCPNPSLRECAASKGLKLSQKLMPFDGVTEILEGEADYGCFVGGMILSLFSDHPIVPVTTTAHSQSSVRLRMTGFFEWLLREDTSAALYADEQKGMGWAQIAKEAAPRLRDRIQELARIRAISLSLEDLLTLAEGHDIVALPIESKYGVRRLPIRGLFCDKPLKDIDAAAQEWAGQLLSGLLGELEVKNHFPNLKDALTLAKSVWDKYLDDALVHDRLELGNLVQALKDPTRSATVDLSRLGNLWSQFSTKTYDEAYITGKRPILDKNVVDVRSGSGTNLSRRWACLMILVRLLQLRCAALQFANQHHAHLHSLMEELLKYELEAHDVYLSWFPVSDTPVDLKNTEAWWHFLHRDLLDASLDINDLLHGRGWDITNESYGMKPGERELLHWYALSLTPQFSRSQWDQQAQRILLGGA